MKKILIVEDDAGSVVLLKIILSKLQYESIFVDTAKMALDIYNENMGDVVLFLIDIGLPGGMDGFDLTKKIREISPDVPIIIQTAQAMPYSIQKGYDSGCNEYITKPFIINDIIKKVNKYIEKN